MAVIRQEANRKYMWISVVWSFVIAYAAAVLFYQSAQWIQRSEQSVLEIIVFLLVLVVVIGLRQYTKRNMRRNNAVANT